MVSSSNSNSSNRSSTDRSSTTRRVGAISSKTSSSSVRFMDGDDPSKRSAWNSSSQCFGPPPTVQRKLTIDSADLAQARKDALTVKELFLFDNRSAWKSSSQCFGPPPTVQRKLTIDPADLAQAKKDALTVKGLFLFDNSIDDDDNNVDNDNDIDNDNDTGGENTDKEKRESHQRQIQQKIRRSQASSSSPLSPTTMRSAMKKNTRSSTNKIIYR